MLRKQTDEYKLSTVREFCHNQQYEKSDMHKNAIIDRLRKEGCRITNQRKIILDIILQEECTCCKEIYYLAAKKDPNIGIATIYRMINLLEEIGALKRRDIYRICEHEPYPHVCNVQLDDQTSIQLDNEDLCKVIEKGMESCGYLRQRKVRHVSINEKIFQ